MDRDAVRAWKRGHDLAEARERETARATPMGERVAQLAMLARTAHALGWETTRAEEIEAVRERFALLHARLGQPR